MKKCEIGDEVTVVLGKCDLGVEDVHHGVVVTIGTEMFIIRCSNGGYLTLAHENVVTSITVNKRRHG